MTFFVSASFLDNTERKFRRAIDLHRIINEQMDADGLLVMDDLATFYTKVEKYQVRSFLRSCLRETKSTFLVAGRSERSLREHQGQRVGLRRVF